jgi:hypothetical protein
VGGYFWAIGRAAPESLEGFSFYGLNIGALFSPPYSILFSDRPFLPPWYEGNFYLGLGVIGLWIVILLFDGKYVWAVIRRHWPISVALVLLTLYSLSNRITLLDRTLFELPLPEMLAPILGMARTAGRLFWPVGYLIIAAAFAITADRFRRGGPILIAMAIIVSCCEAGSTYWYLGGLISTVGPFPLDYPSLQQTMDQNSSIFIFPTMRCSPPSALDKMLAYWQIEYTAARAGLESNSSITARQIKDCSREEASAETLKLDEARRLVVFMSLSAARLAIPVGEREAVLKHCRIIPFEESGLMCSSAWNVDPNGPHAVPPTVLASPPLALNESTFLARRK